MKSHSLIPSLQKSFIPFTCGISVSYITTNSRTSWHYSSRIIHFFVPPGIINSSNSCSNTLCITKISVTCGQTDAYPLTHPSVTAYGDSDKSNTTLSKFILPIAKFPRHILHYHIVPVFRYMTYLNTFLSPCMLSIFFSHISGITNYSLHIPSCLTHPVQHVKSCLFLIPALM